MPAWAALSKSTGRPGVAPACSGSALEMQSASGRLSGWKAQQQPGVSVHEAGTVSWQHRLSHQLDSTRSGVFRSCKFILQFLHFSSSFFTAGQTSWCLRGGAAGAARCCPVGGTWAATGSHGWQCSSTCLKGLHRRVTVLPGIFLIGKKCESSSFCCCCN